MPSQKILREVEDLFEDLRVEVAIAADLFGRRKIDRVLESLQHIRAETSDLEQLVFSVRNPESKKA